MDSRVDLQRQMQAIVKAFLEITKEEDPPLHKALDKLDEADRGLLAGVLGRFDRDATGNLGPRERLFARRILGKLRWANAAALDWTNKILDYMDLDANATLEPNEIDLCVGIFEAFGELDPHSRRLSEHELQVIYLVLRSIDADDSGALEAEERRRLKDELRDVHGFVESQKATNARLRDFLANHRS